MIDPESKRAGIEKLVKIGVVALVAAASVPLAMMALEGLILWGAVAGVTFIAYSFAPVIATWVANKKIQALVAVIEANPIETMKNLFIEKSEELTSKEGNITDFDTELGNFGTEIEKVRRDFPNEVDQYVEIQRKMQEVLSGMRVEQAAAQQALKEFEKHIRKAEMLFNLAKAANKMLEKSKSAQAEYFAELKEQVSFNKVTRDLNRVFANLNTAVERRKNLTAVGQPAQLGTGTTEVIDLGTVGTLHGAKSGVVIGRKPQGGPNNVG